MYIPAYCAYDLDTDVFSPFTADNCNSIASTKGWKYVSCDGTGMSLLVGEVADPYDTGSSPPGVDLTSIEDNVPFSWKDTVDSAVGGWLAGGFNAGIANPILSSYENGGTLSITSTADLQALGATDNATPGLFNILVCQITSFGSIYTENVDNTPGGNQRWCGCLSDKASGGPNHPEQNFSDYAPSAVTSKMGVIGSGNTCKFS